MLPTNRLDLGHRKPTSSNTAQSRRPTATPCRQSREHQASEERGEAKPEESGRCLRFLTSLFIVIGASSHFIGCDVTLVLRVSLRYQAHFVAFCALSLPGCHNCAP